MPVLPAILTGITANLITEILLFAKDKTAKAATRNDRILAILKKCGITPKLNQDSPFEDVYAHTLVEFGLDKPKEILEFFRHEDIQSAFFKAFEKNDLSILYLEAEGLMDWSIIGDHLREKNLDPRLEFARFTVVFNWMVDRTRTPYQARLEGKVDDIRRYIQFPEIEKLRDEILRQIRGNLADQVKGWFKTLGYEQGSHYEETDQYWEWIIKIPARRGYDTILIRATEKQAECNDLDSLKTAVEKLKTDEGWLICSHRVSRDACDAAEKDDTLYCYTFDELLDQHADFSGYFSWLEEQVKQKEIEKYYIPLACSREIINPKTKEKEREDRYAEKDGFTEGYIERWLQAPAKEHISILGEFGTGKTWFTLKFA